MAYSLLASSIHKPGGQRLAQSQTAGVPIFRTATRYSAQSATGLLYGRSGKGYFTAGVAKSAYPGHSGSAAGGRIPILGGLPAVQDGRVFVS